MALLCDSVLIFSCWKWFCNSRAINGVLVRWTSVGTASNYWCMHNAIKILPDLCSRAITSFLPLCQHPGACLGRRTAFEMPLSSCPPCIHSGVGKRQVIILCWKLGKTSNYYPYIQAQKKAIYIWLYGTKPKSNERLFSMCERINYLQWGTTKCSQRTLDGSEPADSQLLSVWAAARGISPSASSCRRFVSLATAPAAHSFHWGNRIYRI